MKPNIQAALAHFAREHNLPPTSDATSERFVTHLVLHDLGFSDFDIEQIISGGANDNQIDALAMTVNGVFVSAIDDVDAALSTAPEASAVRIGVVALQITMSERWEQGKIYSFAGGVSNFFDFERLAPENARLAEWREVKEYLLSALRENALDWTLDLRLFLACASENTPDDNIRGARENARRMIERLGIFSSVRLDLIDGHRLEELNGQWRRSNEAVLRMGGMTALPPSPTVARGWIGWARAEDFLDIVTGKAGGIRPNVFFENVRGFLGDDDAASPINADIARTLRGPEQAEFVYRNNGVAIIARAAEPMGATALKLTGYQIVNGCQTSYSLHQQRAHLDGGVAVPIKVIETSERSAIRSITAATNSQTPIGEAEFLSQLPFVRKLQNYFSGKRLRDGSSGLWLERRANEFAAQRLETPQQILSIVDVVEVYLAAFEERAHLVHDQGWKIALPRIDRGEMLALSDNAEIYYASGLIRWRINQFMGAYAARRVRENAALPAKRRRRSQVYPARHQLALALRLAASPGLSLIARPSFRGGGFDKALGQLIATLRHNTRAAQALETADEAVRAAVRALGETAPFAAESAKKKAVTDYLLNNAPSSS